MSVPAAKNELRRIVKEECAADPKGGHPVQIYASHLSRILTALCSPEPECTCKPCIGGRDEDCPKHGVAKPATTVADKGTEKCPYQDSEGMCCYKPPLTRPLHRCFEAIGAVCPFRPMVNPTASAVDDTAEEACMLCGHVWRVKLYSHCPVCYPPPDLVAVPDTAEGTSGLKEGMIMGEDDLRREMTLAEYVNLLPLSHSAHKEFVALCHRATPKSTDRGHTDPDRSAQSGEGANRLEPDNTCALCGQGVPREDSELKPCPFCGGEAKIYENVDGYYSVACQSCGVQTGQYGVKKGPRGVWNTRVNPPQADTIKGIHTMATAILAEVQEAARMRKFVMGHPSLYGTFPQGFTAEFMLLVLEDMEHRVWRKWSGTGGEVGTRTHERLERISQAIDRLKEVE